MFVFLLFVHYLYRLLMKLGVVSPLGKTLDLIMLMILLLEKGIMKCDHRLWLPSLWSMPVVRREKPKKALFSELNAGNRKNSANDDNTRGSEHFLYDQEEFQLGKGHVKTDSRPQKH